MQEFSQRYASTNLLSDTIELPELRRQDTKNRQNSTDDLDPVIVERLNRQMVTLFSSASALYNQMLEAGVAKECARFVLPLACPTRLYMTGSVRSWYHYIDLRSANGTQKEHMDIALECKRIFKEQFPTVAEAAGW
jgi:thymidylate synthase (FAD)